MLSRRLVLQLPAAAIAGSYAARVLAADKTVSVGINLPLTGADAQAATKIKQGAQLAFDEANAAGGVAGYKINVIVLDDGTATAGQYDPAQAATNARKMVSDSSVVAAVGPQMSGSGKAMSPILSARAIWRSSPRARPTPTSPTRNSPANTGRGARRSISARSPPTPSRARTWRTISPIR